MIHEALGLEVELRAGAPGQFEVEVDGQPLALPKKSFWERLLGGRWPNEGHVVEELTRLAGQ